MDKNKILCLEIGHKYVVNDKCIMDIPAKSCVKEQRKYNETVRIDLYGT